MGKGTRKIGLNLEDNLGVGREDGGSENHMVRSQIKLRKIPPGIPSKSENLNQLSELHSQQGDNPLNSLDLSDEINLTEEMIVKVIKSGEKLPRDSGLSSSQTRLDGGTRISQSEAYPS